MRGGIRVSPISITRETLFRIGHRLALAVTILLVCGVGGLYAVRAMYGGQVLPSVYVADVPVGGMSKSEAQAAVAARANSLLNATMVFDFDGRQWTTTLAELGVSADTAGSVDRAYGVGREPGARDRIESSLRIAQSDQVIPLQMVVDPGALMSWIEAVTTDIGQQPSDSRIVIDGASFTVEPEVEGIVVDQGRLQAIIAEAIENLQPYRGALPLAPKSPDIHATDLEPQVAALTEALSQPITIVYKKKSWELQPADISPFIVQTARIDGPGIELSLDVDGLGQWLLSLVGDRINRDPVDATVQWSNEKERIVALSESSKGIRLLAGPLADLVAESFFGSHKNVDIPVKGLAPKIDSDRIDEMNIDVRLGIGTSSYWGSEEPRATNISVGTAALNGTIVEPGGEFSFNGAVGNITAEAGYVEAPVVDGERIGKDVGGGICQVSTTMFRAAFLAGMPIGDWWPHLYRLPFYEYDGWEAGLDASILQSGPRETWGDFTFFNTTGGYLLIEAYNEVDTQTNVVVIYGPKTEWSVSVSEPKIGEPILGDDQPDVEVVDDTFEPGTVKQTELRQDGLEISYTRTVMDSDGNVIDEWIAYSKFAARGNVYRVSPDMKGQSPAASEEH